MDLARHVRERLTAGPLARAELQQGTGASQATLSRVLRGMPDVRRVGAARATRYALTRRIRDLGPDVPIYRVTRAGRVEPLGMLTAALGGYIADLGRGQDWYDGLPWFMADMTPQGFLGRRFPRQFPELDLPERLSDWSDHHALYAIARRGEDLPGNLIVGEESMQRWHASAGRADVWIAEGDDRVAAYEEMAARVLAGEMPGSSAAGERPKFTVRSGSGDAAVHSIVKFSPPIDEPQGRRWSDLLVCEHLAAQALESVGLPVASSRVYQSGERTFLEVERFDRTGERGRIGVVTLGALDQEFIGEGARWPQAAATLAGAFVRVADYERIVRLHAFGQWIANNDMHQGNLAFLHEGEFPLPLAPCYDMLPMRYAPRSDEVVEVPVESPVPDRFTLPVWDEVREWARTCWKNVADDKRVSSYFRSIAREHRRYI